MHLSCRTKLFLDSLLPFCAKSRSEPCAGSRCAEEGRAYEVGAGNSDPETDSSQARMKLNLVYMPQALYEMPVYECIMRTNQHMWICSTQMLYHALGLSRAQTSRTAASDTPSWLGCSCTVCVRPTMINWPGHCAAQVQCGLCQAVGHRITECPLAAMALERPEAAGDFPSEPCAFSMWLHFLVRTMDASSCHQR